MQLEYVNINPPQPMDKLTVDGGNGNGSAKNKRMQEKKLSYCSEMWQILELKVGIEIVLLDFHINIVKIRQFAKKIAKTTKLKKK